MAETARTSVPQMGFAQSVGVWLHGNRTGRVLIELAKHLLLLPLTVMFLFPWFWMITSSIKTVDQLHVFPIKWIPNPVTLEAYPRAISEARMVKYARNTLFLCGANIVGAVVSNCVVAYGFSRIRWPGRDKVFLLVLATMMLPYQVRMVPLYLVFSKLKWVDTYLPLIVPTFFGSAFFIFLLRQFFRTIPEDLADSARIDGCSELGILARIILPLAKPALAVVALFEFIGNWNSFLGPLIYLNEERLYTLTLGLMLLRRRYETADYNLLMAACILTFAPIVVLFFFTQRTFIEGITLTGLKG
jgi:multiple sugar transport system permease protein